jgi:hypothetical protein
MDSSQSNDGNKSDGAKEPQKTAQSSGELSANSTEELSISKNTAHSVTPFHQYAQDNFERCFGSTDPKAKAIVSEALQNSENTLSGWFAEENGHLIDTDQPRA